jgi:signal transduction histidine kinase
MVLELETHVTTSASANIGLDVPTPADEQSSATLFPSTAHAHGTAQGHTQLPTEQLLGITAHELRAPITSGTLAIQLASRRLDSLYSTLDTNADDLAARLGSLEALLGAASESLRRIGRLADDLAAVAHHQRDQLAISLAPCDIVRVVREAVQEQQRLHADRTIRLCVSDQPMSALAADADRIRQVVTNYLTNAMRYAPAYLPITVHVQIRGRWLEVSVQDQGPGVPCEQRQHIWEPFERLGADTHSTDNPINQVEPSIGLGLGLGLPICKSIVEQHNGNVGVRSAPGGGAIFWFTLPLHCGAAPTD